MRPLPHTNEQPKSSCTSQKPQTSLMCTIRGRVHIALSVPPARTLGYCVPWHASLFYGSDHQHNIAERMRPHNRDHRYRSRMWCGSWLCVCGRVEGGGIEVNETRDCACACCRHWGGSVNLLIATTRFALGNRQWKFCRALAESQCCRVCTHLYGLWKALDGIL